jgi:hypothetical protein
VKRWLRSLVVTPLWAVALWLAAEAAGGRPARAQDPAPEAAVQRPETAGPDAGAAGAGHAAALPEGARKAVEKAASFLATATDPVEARLREIGYDHPGIPDGVWRSFTPYGKMETAYRSAEAGGKGGGERMLALLSRSLAQEYECAAEDPDLKPYLDRPVEGAPPRFAALEPADRGRAADLPPEVRKALHTVSAYCDGGEFGPRAVLHEYFQLGHDQAEEILRTSRTHEQALERGLLAVEASRRHTALERLVGRLDAEYESARSTKEFDSWRPPRERARRTRPPLPADFYRPPETREPFRRGEFGADPFNRGGTRSPFERPDLRPGERPAAEHGESSRAFEHGGPHGSPRTGVMEHVSRGTGRAAAILFLINEFLHNPGRTLVILLVVVVGAALGNMIGGKRR